MVTAILPSLTDESDEQAASAISRNPKPQHAPRRRAARNSIAASVASEATITPELYTRTVSGLSDDDDGGDEEGGAHSAREDKLGRPSALAGYVGVFTGCGALVALSLFLPLPARFGEWEGVSTGQAVEYSFYVVALVSLVVGILVFLGLRGLNGEEGKGWGALLRVKRRADSPASSIIGNSEDGRQRRPVLPYLELLRESVKLGFTDSNIALGYIGGFVARASTVAISLFLPLYINTYFIGHGFCHGSPHDPSPELKKECRAAYILASILSGVAQLIGLVCAPLFGYLSSRTRRTNYPVYVASAMGVLSYSMFPRLRSPEVKDIDGRGGGPFVFLLVSLMGVSQIGAIVCSLGSLGRGVLSADDSSPPMARSAADGPSSQPPEHEEANGNVEPDELGEPDESTTLLSEDGDYFHGTNGNAYEPASGAGTRVNRVRLKGSIAGVYSWCGGAAILLLAKLGGYLFDEVGTGAPFYMMAVFNLIWLLASFGIDMSREFRDRD